MSRTMYHPPGGPAPLTGGAVGDALGMPFESVSSDDPRLVAWDGSYWLSEHHRLAPGQFTDDTQMSLALAEAILEHGHYDPTVAAQKYLKWFESGDCRGIETSTRTSMLRLAQGLPWHQSGDLGTYGNGSAMRAAPFGLRHRKSNPEDSGHLKTAAYWARCDSTITHASLEAKEGAAAVAMAVCHLSSGGSKETLAEVVRKNLCLGTICDALENFNQKVRAGPLSQNLVVSGGIPARVGSTVIAAFAMFLWTDNFEKAVHNAVLLGGDTDTVASITGALSGSYYGYDGIPQGWLDGLEDAARIREIEIQLDSL